MTNIAKPCPDSRSSLCKASTFSLTLASVAVSSCDVASSKARSFGRSSSA
eukprot:CAMPEP_0115668672 /NCGR_PEP_ID=MMETSP0272-20121206/50595_1 /TAXON_ID=71861 /ORGANISM="Scrippsiella trochoidea, Strain CCMP3099" /LENGTH=49 /DNA_ID= /DNA_START= /DNA_END= /DNA_ORIENTATION=